MPRTVTTWFNDILADDPQSVVESVADGVVASDNPATTNEPAGFVTGLDLNFNSGVPTDDFDFVLAGSGGTRTPSYDNGELLYSYQAGFAVSAGSSYQPGKCTRETGETNLGPRYYVRAEFKISSNFHGHSTGINKLFYNPMRRASGSVINSGHFLMIGSNNNPIELAWQSQAWYHGTQRYEWDTAGNLASPSAADATITRNQSHVVEGLFDGGTAGSADAEMKAWLDGKLVLHFTGLQAFDTGDTVAWFGCNIHPVWGGQGDTIPSGDDMELRFNSYYTSGGV